MGGSAEVCVLEVVSLISFLRVLCFLQAVSE